MAGEAKCSNMSMKGHAKVVVVEIGSSFEQRWESEVIRGNGVCCSHEGEKVEGLMERWERGMGFDDGVEEENVGVMGLGENESGVRDLVKGDGEGDEVGEDLVGLVEAMAEEMGVDLREMSVCFGVVKEM